MLNFGGRRAKEFSQERPDISPLKKKGNGGIAKKLGISTAVFGACAGNSRYIGIYIFRKTSLCSLYCG
ncbi:MAG: hypothetical protein KatS3mg101_0360 [Patescibacteria group bacterium]|nr:MAG: hypothetical protein KatS3mg101_0360 [Patescibacteria group bacterium]